jgi:hypothetical protein
MVATTTTTTNDEDFALFTSLFGDPTYVADTDITLKSHKSHISYKGRILELRLDPNHAFFICIGYQMLGNNTARLLYSNGKTFRFGKQVLGEAVVVSKLLKKCATGSDCKAPTKSVPLIAAKGGGQTSFINRIKAFFMKSNQVVPVLVVQYETANTYLDNVEYTDIEIINLGQSPDSSDSGSTISSSPQGVHTDHRAEIVALPPDIMENIFKMLDHVDAHSIRLTNQENKTLVDSLLQKIKPNQLDLQMRVREQLYYYILMIAYFERHRLKNANALYLSVACMACGAKNTELFHMTTTRLTSDQDPSTYTTKIKLPGVTGQIESFVHFLETDYFGNVPMNARNLYTVLKDKCKPDWAHLMQLGSVYNSVKTERLSYKAHDQISSNDIQDLLSIVETTLHVCHGYYDEHIHKLEIPQTDIGNNLILKQVVEIVRLLTELMQARTSNTFKISAVFVTSLHSVIPYFNGRVTFYNKESDPDMNSVIILYVNSFESALGVLQVQDIHSCLAFNNLTIIANSLVKFALLLCKWDTRIRTAMYDFCSKYKSDIEPIITRIAALYVIQLKLGQTQEDGQTQYDIISVIRESTDTLVFHDKQYDMRIMENDIELRNMLILGHPDELKDSIDIGIGYTIALLNILTYNLNDFNNIAKMCLYGRPHTMVNDLNAECVDRIGGMQWDTVKTMINTLKKTTSLPCLRDDNDTYQYIYKHYIAEFMTKITNTQKQFIFRRLHFPSPQPNQIKSEYLEVLDKIDERRAAVDKAIEDIRAFNETDPMRNIKRVLLYDRGSIFVYIFNEIDKYYKPFVSLASLNQPNKEVYALHYKNYNMVNRLSAYEKDVYSLSPDTYNGLPDQWKSIRAALTMLVKIKKLVEQVGIFKLIGKINLYTDDATELERMFKVTANHVQNHPHKDGIYYKSLKEMYERDENRQVYYYGMMFLLEAHKYNDTEKEKVNSAIMQKLSQGDGKVIQSIISISKTTDYDTYVKNITTLYHNLYEAQNNLYVAMMKHNDMFAGGSTLPNRYLYITNMNTGRRMRKPLHTINNKHMVRYHGINMRISSYKRRLREIKPLRQFKFTIAK